MHAVTTSRPTGRRLRYTPPADVRMISVGELIEGVRTIPDDQRPRFGFDASPRGFRVWCAGEPDLAKLPAVSVVGTRKVSPEGAARARRIGRELASAAVVVVSGLAAGVDTIAMSGAIENAGVVIGVIGTGIDRAYPAENAPLQERIYREHLLISQFEPGSRVFPSNFPKRNQLMAAISDATVIIEASDTSGTRHQAAECLRLDRPLFIAKSVVDNPATSWTGRFVGKRGVHILTDTAQILDVVGRRAGA